MALVLHAAANNKNTFKSLIAAEYSGVKVELAKGFVMGVSNKTPEFLKMHPMGKVPVMETPDGPLFESNAIARYVARLKTDNPLYGSSLIEYARIEQWIDFASTELDHKLSLWLYPRLGHIPYIPQVEEFVIPALKRVVGALNTHLAANTYLVGHTVTLADIIMTCNLYSGFSSIMTKAFTGEFPHVERYFWTMANQPNFSKMSAEYQVPSPLVPARERLFVRILGLNMLKLMIDRQLRPSIWYEMVGWPAIFPPVISTGVYLSLLQQEPKIRLAAYRLLSALLARPWCFSEVF